MPLTRAAAAAAAAAENSAHRSFQSDCVHKASRKLKAERSGRALPLRLAEFEERSVHSALAAERGRSARECGKSAAAAHLARNAKLSDPLQSENVRTV